MSEHVCFSGLTLTVVLEATELYMVYLFEDTFM
jgi:hypothetical protein